MGSGWIVAMLLCGNTYDTNNTAKMGSSDIGAGVLNFQAVSSALVTWWLGDARALK